MTLPSSRRPVAQARPQSNSAKREPQGAPPPEVTQLQVRMRQILAESDFPAISKDALDALKHMPEDDASIQRLANIVLREYSLTLKVLRTANSAYYKRSDQQIQSAAHAMLLLGARTVRHLAGSLLAFEHYRKRSPGLKELMLLSLLTANHARETAMRRGLPDPEEAHLCGMFRNLGEVLIAGYCPAEYARILQHMEQKNKGESVAAFDVLGFRFEELGNAMATHWGMPESVSAAIRADGPNASSEISVIAAFAHDLTYAVYRREIDHKRDSVGDVLSRYARRLNLTREQVSGILQAALHETKEVFASAKVSLDDLRLKRLNGQAMMELGSWSPTPTGGMPTQPSLAAAQEDAGEIQRLRTELSAEVLRVVQPSSGEDLNRMILIVLEAIFRGGPFDRVIFCMMTPDRSALKARYGLGASADQVLERFSFELSPKDGPIPVAMLRRQSIYVPVERDFTAQELRFAQSLGSSSFGVFPVVVGGRLLGCVFCDRPWNSKLPDRATLSYVRSLCDGAVRGIEARATGGIPAVAMRPASGTQTVIANASALGGQGLAAAARGASGAHGSVIESRGVSGSQSALGASKPATGTQSAVRPTPTYSAAHKSEVVLRLLRGDSPAVLTQETGVPEATLEKWKAEFLAGAIAGLRNG